MSLGPKFALPLNSYNDIPIHNIITSVESAIREQPTSTANEIRTKITSTVSNHKNLLKSTNSKLPKNKSLLLNYSAKTKTFLRNNPHLMIARTDKSNKTVIMDTDTYDNKCLQLLNDQNVYKKT